MALKAYEDVCLRAELFGQPKPDKEDFLEKNKHLDIIEFEEVDIRAAENTAMLTDDLKTATGGMAELNTILTSTQTKINRLKGVCGSLTQFFRVKMTSKDNLSYSSEPSYVGQTNYDKDYIPTNTDLGSINTGLGPKDNELTINVPPTNGGSSKQNDDSLKKQDGVMLKNQDGGDINAAIGDLKMMQTAENVSVLKQAAGDVGKQMTSQMSKLDKLISQADRAQSSLQHQNKQLRSVLR